MRSSSPSCRRTAPWLRSRIARGEIIRFRCRDDLFAHPLRAGGQQLHHQHVAVAIDDHAREAVAVAVDQPVAVGIARRRRVRAARARARCASGRFRRDRARRRARASAPRSWSRDCSSRCPQRAPAASSTSHARAGFDAAGSTRSIACEKIHGLPPRTGPSRPFLRKTRPALSTRGSVEDFSTFQLSTF